MALEHWLQLALTDGLGPILISRLIEATESAENACGATESVLRQVEGIGSKKTSSIATSLRAARGLVDQELDRAAKLGVTIVSRDDPTYPALLLEIPDPPVVLYVKGSIEARDLNAVAIVGSRNCTHYGREQADRFASLLARAGMTVVSGGARGIDSAAHRGAITHPLGRTIAVLGSGLDVPYPPENVSLFQQVAERGACVSEYPFGTEPRAENFPRRNRIISGMSRGVLVVEADVRSGALLTARQAIEDHARPVFAIPGRIDNPMSAGPHKLIREGATLVSNLNEILDGLGPLPANISEPIALPELGSVVPLIDVAAPQLLPVDSTLTDRQQSILATLDGDSMGVDALVERTEMPAHIILQELTFLTLKGLVKRVDGQTYARARKRA